MKVGKDDKTEREGKVQKNRKNKAKEKKKNKGIGTEEKLWQCAQRQRHNTKKENTTIDVKLEMNVIFFFFFAFCNFPNFMIFYIFLFFHVLECSFVMNDGC